MKKIIKIISMLLIGLLLIFTINAFADTGGSGNIDGGAASVSA